MVSTAERDERNIRLLKDLNESFMANRFKMARKPRIAFDWNLTVDARGSGIGIPSKVLDDLKALGYEVVIYTSSIKSERKYYGRDWALKHGIPFSDDENILDVVDFYVGDKDSDERRAGRHGVTFVRTEDFDLGKILTEDDQKKLEKIRK